MLVLKRKRKKWIGKIETWKTAEEEKRQRRGTILRILRDLFLHILNNLQRRCVCPPPDFIHISAMTSFSQESVDEYKVVRFQSGGGKK